MDSGMAEQYGWYVGRQIDRGTSAASDFFEL